MQHSRIQILRAEIHSQRIALIGDIHVQFCCQQFTTLKIVRLGTQSEMVRRGVHHKVNLRARSQLQTLRDSIQQRVDILHRSRQSRVAIINTRTLINIVKLKAGQILRHSRLQIFYHIGVGRRTCEGCIDKIRSQIQRTAVINVSRYEFHSSRRERVGIVHIASLIKRERAIHIV